MSRHPTTKTWTFPADDRAPIDLPRVNLRELVARPERFEHHLLVCATLGQTQLEIVTASEPLYFGHVNLSDEYALPLPTGDVMVDHFPMRTFVADAASGEDVARYNHRTGDLVLHPVGYLHWPGRLRPPYAPMEMAPGMRRTTLSLVFCASSPAASTAPVIALPAKREADVKAYATPAPPLAIAALSGAPGVIAAIGTTTLALVEQPGTIAPPRGGWVVIIEATGTHAPCDLIRVPAGGSLEATGVARALVVSDPVAEPDPVPPSWTEVPAPPFAVFEDAAPGALPPAVGTLAVEPIDDTTVRIAGAAVPRYWLARMLFRAALHDLRLGYVETYGGLYLDDRFGKSPTVALGIRGGVAIELPRAEMHAAIEQLYRAVAPPGYRERVD